MNDSVTTNIIRPGNGRDGRFLATPVLSCSFLVRFERPPGRYTTALPWFVIAATGAALGTRHFLIRSVTNTKNLLMAPGRYCSPLPARGFSSNSVSPLSQKCEFAWCPSVEVRAQKMVPTLRHFNTSQYQSKIIRGTKNVPYDAHLCPIIVK